MSSTITGVGSGFDIDGWVSQLVAIKQSSTVTPLEEKLSILNTQNTAVSSLKSKYTALQSSLQAFTNIIYNSTSDMWTNTTINSSNSTYATATSTGTVGASLVELEVEQVATATVAKSAFALGSISKENIENTRFADLANGQAKEGVFSMFLNGKVYDIEIKSDDTLKQVLDNISDETDGKVKATVGLDGKISIQAYKEVENPDGSISEVVDETANLLIGSSADTSNFVSALSLHDRIGEYGYQSSYVVSTVNTSQAMASNKSGLGEIKFYDENGNDATSGTITINGVDFEIDENTSLNSLISRINGNSDANVKASYDSLTNCLILTSTQTGQNNIALKSSGTNLLNVLGLTTGEGENEVIAKNSQTLGQNAIAYINGNKVISTSNTITGESSGISNLSITIKKPTSAYSNDAEDDKKVTLDIEPDYSQVKTALEAFVKAYNDVVETTRSMTKSDGDIGRDTALDSVLNSVRSLTSDVSDNKGMYSMLAEIGISTSRSDATRLSIDSKKLEEALSKNFDSVKELISDGYVNKSNTGLFDRLLDDVNSVLDTQRGYFAQKNQSLTSQITSMNNRIERANTRLNNYHERLLKQFNAMDATISNLNTQLSTFQSFI